MTTLIDVLTVGFVLFFYVVLLTLLIIVVAAAYDWYVTSRRPTVEEELAEFCAQAQRAMRDRRAA
jgi:hypothetical protein